jgi:4-hydroxy 2-oxovalerate aldolase
MGVFMSNQDAVKSAVNPAKAWVGYRPEIKVLDCTVRDGGLMNEHKFADKLVQNVLETCKAAGVDYMEVGYKADKKVFQGGNHGKWKFCDEEDVKALIDGAGGKGSVKLSVMADVGRTDVKKDLPDRKDGAFDMIRVACYIHQIPTAMDMVKEAKDKGYEACINIMAISTVQESALDSALELVSRSEADVIYLVDSFGSLYGEQIRYLAQKYLGFAKAAGKEVGIHAHNNMQLAYANTLECITEGVNLIDATLSGLGRGAGNCPLELLLGFLHNPKFHIRPVLQCVQDYIEPLKNDFFWGYDIPYMVTGLLNRHPRSAMKFIEEKQARELVKFYNQVEGDEAAD